MEKMAILTAPAGWKVLTDSEKMQFLRDNFGDEDGLDVIAVALPNGGDGSVYAQLVFQDVGYVDDTSAINSNSVRENIINELNILNKENDSGDSDQVHFKNFALRPTYDRKTHCVKYGIELTFGREPAINLYKMCLVRNGALVLTLVGTPRDRLNLNDWKIIPDDDLDYSKFDPNRDERAEGNLNHLLSMNRFL